MLGGWGFCAEFREQSRPSLSILMIPQQIASFLSKFLNNIWIFCGALKALAAIRKNFDLFLKITLK
jgi:hypothetical protein